MTKKDEHPLPNDITSLQSMVRKRDSIIAEIRAASSISVSVNTKALLDDHATLKADYESCCEQLKARDGDVKRLEDRKKKLAETNSLLLGSDEASHLKMMLLQRQTEYDELNKLYQENVKQLDQESDSNVELEDDITILKKAIKDRTIKSEDIIMEVVPDKRDEEIKLLQEKLALCDEWYKVLESEMNEVKEISSRKLHVTFAEPEVDPSV